MSAKFTYLDGQRIQLGDKVALGPVSQGVVVGIVHEQAYLPPFDRDDWSYLGQGLLVESDHGLIFYEAIFEHEPCLVARA